MKKKMNSKKQTSIVFSYITAFLLLSLCLFPSSSLAADESLCARVKIEIRQELTLERQAFDAHMAINNGLTNITLENVDIDVRFSDKDGNSVLASSDPNNPDALFFIRVDSMQGISSIEGTGTVAPSSTADIHWLIIPAPGASNGLEQGALYFVGATLKYTIGGKENVTEVSPDYIYVKPMPEMVLDYFLPNDVYGDDPFTPEIEPPIPFSLGVRVKNNGTGTARNLKIDSAQPKIVDNDQGLLVNFMLTGSEVNGQAAANSLLINFGDIAPNTSGTGRWFMTCTLSGKFVDFKATFSHSDELGGQLTSLIDAVNTHFLIHDVLVDLSGRDAIRDFLAKDGDTYKVYESGSVDTEVSDQSAFSSLSFKSQAGIETSYTLSTPVTAGFMYVRLTDPFSGQKILKEVIRSDGKRIKADNAWLSMTRHRSDPWQYFFNLFDVATTNSYTVVFTDPAGVNHPPVLQFIPDKTGVEGQHLSFIVEASDPDGTIPSLSASPLPALATFTNQGNGTGVFDWVPTTGQTGRYEITFTASDGVLKTSQRVVITITGTGNNPPLAPSSPSPLDGAGNISVKASLSWTGGDPDPGNTVTYDVYLGTSNPPTVKVSGGQSGASYLPPSILAYGTTHYWKIVARDNLGAETAGPVWRFTTFYANGDADGDGLTNQQEIELGKDPFTPDNDPPVANAGSDQNVITGEVVTLNGSGNDPEGLPITFAWSFAQVPAGSNVTNGSLSSTTIAGPQFTPDVKGDYRLQLTVRDGFQNSAPDEMIITATALNEAPIANAGKDRNTMTGRAFTLNGSESYDPDEDLITFVWTFVEVPTGSVVTNSSLSDATSPKPEFTPDVDGTYRLQLIVRDGDLDSAPDEVAISSVTANVPPNADAGHSQNVLTGSMVQLDGSQSNDPDDGPQPLAYLWQFVSKPAGSLLTDDDIVVGHTPNASFNPDVNGTYELRLTVSDSELSSEDSVWIIAGMPNVAPNSNAGVDITVNLGDTAVLDGSASNDPDTGPQPLTYLWRFVSLPSGSQLTDGAISGANTVSPSFIPDVLGTFVLSLTVFDGEDAGFDHVAVTVVQTSVITITATASPGGTISPSGAVTVEEGASQTFTIAPDTGYHIVDVKVDGTSVGTVTSYTFSGVTSDHTIEASFAINQYTLTATTGPDGSISPSGAVTVDHGANQTFTITPDAGYHILDVKADGVSVGIASTYTFDNVTSNHTIEARFAINQYTITATAGSNGAISPSGAVTVNEGGSYRYSITPYEGYSIEDVKVDGVSVGAVTVYTISNITADHTIEASFAINQYTLIATASSGGIISPSGSIVLNYGGSQTFTLTPNPGCHILDVKVDGVSVGAVTTYTFNNVASGHTIEARFAINQYTITARAGSNGAITPSGFITVDEGGGQTFTITPNEGCRIIGVWVDSEFVGAVNTYTFTNIASNHTIEAIFGTGFYSVDLPRTGQTAKYALNDDGTIRSGIIWPIPRFTVNADTTVTDNLTGLVWALDAGTPMVGACTEGPKTWQGALDYVGCLNTQNYLGHNDWRLPNLNELESLSHAGEATTPTWLISQGFANVGTGYYWSSTTLASSSNEAWAISLQEGEVAYGAKDYTSYVWPVRGETSAPAPALLWNTGQTTSYATGDDGQLREGVAWPGLRFTVGADATLTDSLTGLIWAPNAEVPSYGTCVGGPKPWQDALSYIDCLNTNSYLGHSDWRMPNRKELRSLIHYGQGDMTAWLNAQGFYNTNPGQYWSSTTYAASQEMAWSIDMISGEMIGNDKATQGYLLAVRAGTITQNLAPYIAPTGGGVYKYNTPVVLGGQVSDFDGDLVTYQWAEGQIILFSGQIQTIPGGSPVNLPGQTTSLSLGAHVITLRASDGVNPPVTRSLNIQIIDTAAPMTTALPPGGTYNSAQSVTLACSDGTGSGCDKIYYTTDGSMPTTSSPVYSSPISISATKTLKFFARDLAGNSEAVKSETYTITTGTSMVTVQLRDSTGNPLSGGVVQYYSGGWQAFGTTDASGRVSKELVPGTYTFSMNYAYARQEKSQNTATNSTVIFQTTGVTVQLKDSTGALMDTGTVQYYSGGWRDIGSTSGGQVFKELLPLTYTFSMTYGFARQEKSQNVSTNPKVVFQTTRVAIQLKDSTGALIDTGTVQYYSGGWRDIGSTSGGQVTKELLPGTYTFSMNYAFARQEKSQNIATNPTVVFQTTNVTIQLKDSTGALMDAGTVQYYSGGWRDIGSTSGGQVTKELLPGTYTFSMNYAFARQEKAQNIATNPTVVFQTTRVTIELRDSTNSLMDTGTVQYYSGGWHDIGTTSGGQVTKELLPASYTFSMNYAYARQEKAQNIATNPTVVFQTTRVTIELRDSTNSLMDTGTVQYYSGGWHDIGSTSGGQVIKELLPLTYTFSMNYGFARQEKSQNIVTNPTVVFQTGQVHSDSGSCIQYYAGGWRVFTQDMELLPATYTFRFNDGTSDSSYTIITGTINHIH